MNRKNNAVITAIKERRSIREFKDKPIPEEDLQAILEAGRWAPSFANTQPWSFIVVQNQEKKDKLFDILQDVTVFSGGVKHAPSVVTIAVDLKQDDSHHIEAGAVAAQNIALAAHSLGYGSYWIGVYDYQDRADSSEKQIQDSLEIPDHFRVTAVLPIGEPDEEKTSTRRPLSTMLYYDNYGK